ncbi:hypothetical protein WJX77_008193 [Trebouxia sp. C0004]
MSSRIHLLVTAALIAVTAGSANAAPVLGTGFVVAAEGATCQQTCTAASLTPAFLNNFYTDASTYLCAANVSGKAWIAGYQTAAPVCTTTHSNTVINATQYACLCLTPEQTPGLESSTGAESCDQTCAQTLDGEVGTAVRPDASLPIYTCLPGSEAGTHNRFGYADDQAVPYTLGSEALALEEAAGVETLPAESIPCVAAAVNTTATYSCFCTFEPQTPATSTSSSSSISTPASVATAGRKLLF